MLALFRAKFACILAISNPVFRWESCKGNEWESVKKCSRLCKDAETRGWTRGWLATGKPPKLAHVWSMWGSWRVMPAVALQDKSLRLARPLAHGLNSRLSPVTRSSRQTTLFGKNWLFTFLSQPTIYRPLYPQNIESFQRDFWERNPREKQDWFIHNLHIETLQIPLLSSSPLLNPWEAHYQNLSSPYPYLWEGHLVFGKQLRRDQFHIGRCYGQVAESGKLKKK